MRLLEALHQQRRAFLRKGYDVPNIVVVPYHLRHQFIGELVDAYALCAPMDKATTVMGMRVRYSADAARIEVALCLD